MKLLQFFWMRWPRVPRKGCQLDVDRQDSVNSELKHPAIWRDKELHMNLVGSVVFGGLLKHGDVVLLFTDIDQKCFER
jgi:hypothetical protein